MRHLDTCIVIACLNGNQTIAEKLKLHLPDAAISTVVLGELLYGARASARSSENLRNLRKFLRLVDIIDYDPKSKPTLTAKYVSHSGGRGVRRAMLT